MAQPFVPLANGAQVEFIGGQGGAIVECRLWFVNRQPPNTHAQIIALAANAGAWWSAQVLPNLSSQYTFILSRATDWTGSAPRFSFDQVFGADGFNTSGIHSANVSIRVSFKGDNSQTFPNNSNFVPGIPRDQVDGNVYSNTIKNGLFNAYVNLIDLAATFGPFPAWRWVITSRQAGNAYRTAQVAARTDFIRFPSRYISPRRKRIHA